jgi:sugar lactone lactonase YvrE
MPMNQKIIPALQTEHRGGGGSAKLIRGPAASVCCALAACAALVADSAALAQRPDIPPQAIVAPDLGYVPIEPSAAVHVPDGFEFSQVAAVDFDTRGHLFVLNRGDEALLEFDASGNFVRSLGQVLFDRAHGLHIDDEGNFWVTDVGAHTVMKLNARGDVLMTLGTAGRSGIWDETAGSRLFDEPTDVAVAPNGDFFVTQGHGRGDPRVLKFSPSGRFLTSWGGRGTHPWQFVVAHSIAIGADGLVYVADRENRRVLVFNLDGEFVKGWLYRGMACGLDLADDGSIFMATGFDGQIVKLAPDGVVLGVTGRPGERIGEYGEAHDLAVSPRGEIFVADVVNRRLQKLVERQEADR